MGQKEMVNEDVLQSRICRLLQDAGIFFHSIPNEAGGRSRVMQTRLMSMGLRPGVGDLLVWWPVVGGVRLGYLEVKTAKGRQSDSQRLFQRYCEMKGVPYRVVRSVEDVEALLEPLRREFSWTPFQTVMEELARKEVLG